jgi:hypothetical protein
LQHDNALLLADYNVNPWVLLFEEKLNFRRANGGIRNVQPKPGEQAEYPNDLDAGYGYGRIVYLPNLAGNGMVLLLSGPLPGGEATLASAEFASSPTALQELYDLFGVRAISELPPFEVLIKVRAREGAPTESEIVAWRTYPEMASLLSASNRPLGR